MFQYDDGVVYISRDRNAAVRLEEMAPEVEQINVRGKIDDVLKYFK